MAAPPPAPDVDLSLWAATLTVAGLLWGPRAGQFLAAYALSLLGWFAGLLVGLYRRDMESKLPAWVYALITLIICIGVTVPASQFLAARLVDYTDASFTGFLLPVAFLISAAPDKWAAMGRKLYEKWQALQGGGTKP